MSTRASAVRPAKARHMCSSSFTILRTVRASCSFAVDFFSTPAAAGNQRLRLGGGFMPSGIAVTLRHQTCDCTTHHLHCQVPSKYGW